MGDSRGINAVIWDFGGVLVRTANRAARERWERRLGLEVGELDQRVFRGEQGKLAAVGKADVEAIWESVCRDLGLSEGECSRLAEDFWSADKLDEELVEYIRRLREDFATGLLSNAWGDLRQYLETEWKIADIFDTMVISAEVGVAKPDPRIYRIVLDRLGVPPDQAVFIDDFPENLPPAQELGLATILFTDREEVLRQLEALLFS
jgi:epoxide hydrolase-like predicted phosphatase